MNEKQVGNVINKIHQLLPKPPHSCLPHKMMINKALEQKCPVLANISIAREKRKIKHP
ncbi:hypothetical protein [Acinetobacter sp. SFB]|uniref:hypothetical protein n=1 Tax=Acinetobacter sp. SFB TaxID=1805634 RepID=UPI000A8F82CE|nr:hypothetical protein [Acinetobacter sp. SFB]